jgi:hypothetical protein
MLFHYRSCGHLFGSLAVLAGLFGGFFDVLVLPLLL